jgi:NADH:ubiquinone oxidoreductase subunit E
VNVMIPETPILVSSELVMKMLSLTQEQVTWLSDTDQLQPIHICGQVRFDARDVHRLVESYKATQARRKGHVR